jgi:hypothetical protein
MELMEMDFSSKICYTVFHTEKTDKSIPDLIREHCVKKAHQRIAFHNLNSPTISIKKIDDVKDFLAQNNEFVLDPAGFDPDHSRSEKRYDKENAMPKGWQLSPIGIWASSYTAYKNFLKSQYDYLVIFEDDLLIEKNFNEVLLSYMKELPESWDIFYQYNPERNVKVRSITSESTCRPNQLWSNACYVISRQGAEKAVASVENQPGAYLPIDWHFLKQQDKFDIYTVQPWKDMACRLVHIDSSYYRIEEQQNLTGLI